MADAELPPNSEFIQTHDGKYKLYTREWKPDGEPKAVVTFVHGLGEHCNRYEHVFSEFAKHGILVQAFDHRGHGRSEGSRGCGGSWKELLGDVDTMWARAPQGIDIPHFLYGHSMGGGISLSYASKKEADGSGIAGVIVTGPMLRTTKPPPAVKVFFGKMFASITPNTAVDNEIAVEGISRDPAEVDKYKQDPLVHPKIGLRLASDMLSNTEECLKQGGPRFKHPLYLIHGGEDALTSAKASEEWFQTCASVDKQLNIIEGGFHEVHNDPGKEELIDSIREWILERA